MGELTSGLRAMWLTDWLTGYVLSRFKDVPRLLCGPITEQYFLYFVLAEGPGQIEQDSRLIDTNSCVVD